MRYRLVSAQKGDYRQQQRKEQGASDAQFPTSAFFLQLPELEFLLFHAHLQRRGNGFQPSDLRLCLRRHVFAMCDVLMQAGELKGELLRELLCQTLGHFGTARVKRRECLFHLRRQRFHGFRITCDSGLQLGDLLRDKLIR